MQSHEDLHHFTDLRKEQFDALYQLSQSLNAAVYQETLIADALDLAIKVTDAERGLFVRHQPETGQFEVIAGRNVEQQDIVDLSEFSSGILNTVVSQKQPCLYHDVQSNPALSQFDSVQIHHIKSVIGVPIFSGRQVWGVIMVDSRQNRQAFTEENLRFLGFFSNMVSLALDRILSTEALRDENQILRKQIEAAQKLPEMIGNSPAMRHVANLIHRVAKTDATVLLTGESGTGKDLAAQAIHKLSARKDCPFLAQFCGSIPDTLLESELFGYKRGAFTGATADKKGLFEVASSGTFFLDEIAEISMALQAKLLRVLQNQEIIRLGDTQVKKINVRIIAATNKDLRQLVMEGKFRQDLFYRLNVFPVMLPTLRDRRPDIALLAEHFLRKFSDRLVRLHPAALRKLESYSWPGNVRQLENVLQRALILCDGDKLLPEHIIFEEENNPGDFSGTLSDYTKMLLLKRLEDFGGNRTLTAKSLGVSVRWVQLKLKEFDKAE
jgi:Nif-specific regulatory protein